MEEKVAEERDLLLFCHWQHHVNQLMIHNCSARGEYEDDEYWEEPISRKVCVFCVCVRVCMSPPLSDKNIRGISSS